MSLTLSVCLTAFVILAMFTLHVARQQDPKKFSDASMLIVQASYMLATHYICKFDKSAVLLTAQYTWDILAMYIVPKAERQSQITRVRHMA